MALLPHHRFTSDDLAQTFVGEARVAGVRPIREPSDLLTRDLLKLCCAVSAKFQSCHLQ